MSRLAVIIGHTWRSPGAYSNTLGESEYVFNERLAAMMLAASEANRLAIFRRDGGGIRQAYYCAKAWGLRGDEPFGTIELHFNAASASASGTETLYTRPESKPLAEAAQTAMLGVLQLPDRGVKLPWQGRGEDNLNQLTALWVPSIIVEPFFGSNPRDSEVARQRMRGLAAAIVDSAFRALEGD